MNEYTINLNGIVLEDAHYTGSDKPSCFCCIIPDKLAALLDSVHDKYIMGTTCGKQRMISYISETEADGNANIKLISGYFIDDPVLHILSKNDYAKIKLYFM